MKTMKNYTVDILGPIILFISLLPLNGILLHVCATVEHQPSNVTFPAMFVIGDSTVDTGNNNRLLVSLTKSNLPPYGRDFVGRKPTGRFSNGKLVADFVASKLGIKETMPAFSQPGINTIDLLTGVSFGSAGTGLDNLTSLISLGIPTWKQLEYLDKTLRRLKVVFGREKVEQIISEALFFVSTGSVDYLAYFNVPFRSFEFDISEYTSSLVQASSHVVKVLYGLGARKIVHVGVPPLGCTPLQRTIHGHHRDCDEDINSACVQHNFKLSQEIEKLDKELHGCKVIYADVYFVLLDIIRNLKKYGFEEESLGCCGTGYVEIGLLCNPFLPSCKNASTHVFWDGLHPTDRACEIIANGVVKTVTAKFG